jgi:CRP-like cAMP-binding protein
MRSSGSVRSQSAAKGELYHSESIRRCGKGIVDNLLLRDSVAMRILSRGLQGLTGKFAIAPLASKFESLGMDEVELDALVQFVKPRPRLRAGADIIYAGQSSRCSTLLLSGIACSYRRLEDGSRQIYSFHYPGDFCDLYRYVLPEEDRAIAVQALTDCSIATIAYADIEQLLVQRPRVGLALWRATMLDAGILRERLLNAQRGSALQRVANLLCEQLARLEAIGIASPIVPITQVDIANAAALSIVHVNRTVQTLRSLNVLSKTSHTIEVADQKQLARIAGFDGRYLNMPEHVSKWAVQMGEEDSASLRRPMPMQFASNRKEPRAASEKTALIAGPPADRRLGKAPR